MSKPAEGSWPRPDTPRDLSALQFRVVPFTAELLPLVQAFSEAYWARPRTSAFYRWRYLESLPFSRMYLAVTEDECLGMVFAFRKTYRIQRRETPCLEIFDWHSLPGLSGSGIGIRVMRAMMREQEPLLGVGGTAEVLKVLPAMRWQTIGSAINYELPLRGEALEDGLRRRMPARLPGERILLRAAATWFQPRGGRRLGEAIPVAALGPEINALYDEDSAYDFVQKPSPDCVRWLTSGYPGAGSFRFWYYMVGGRLRGWSLTRLYDTEQGREAAIVDLFASNPDEQLYAWMVSQAALSLAGEGPMMIRTRASCPILQAALRGNKFRPGEAVPVFRSPTTDPPPKSLHITLNHTDASLRPYPTSSVFVGP
jgi:hypothetical protein